MAFLLLAPEPALALLSVSIYLSDRAALAGRELEVGCGGGGCVGEW